MKDLRTHLADLEERGLLFRVQVPVDKNSELMPMVRWQYRGLEEEERRAFLFQNVTHQGRRLPIPVVVGAIGASRRVFASALDIEAGGIRDRWIAAMKSSLAPVEVDASQAPVKEVVMRGEEVRRRGLSAFPVPISTPGYDPGPFITSGHWVTKDPETGIRNVGNYRAQVKAPDRLGCQIFPTQHIGIHLSKWIQAGRPMPAAVVIGAPPAVAMVAPSKLAYGTDEFAVAGALAGEPVRLVRCETVDIEVPADAEIVLEGYINIEEVEPEAPFGEFSGYVGERSVHPFFEISCITHRRNPVYQAFISQFPPSESTKVRGIANEAVYYDILKNSCNIPSVLDVAFEEAAGAHHLVVIQMDKTAPSQPWQALKIASGIDPTYAKICIAVDKDIDPRDLGSVMWALATRMQPHLDVRIMEGMASQLDPSSAPPDLPNEKQWYPDPRGTSTMMIDATRKWNYPPVALPKERYMRRAMELWSEAGLPPLKPKVPWFGYPLGPWPAEMDEEAERAARGDYAEGLARLIEQRRKRDGWKRTR